MPRRVWTDLDEARTLCCEVDGGALYLARLDELELELLLIEALGEPKRVRPLAARRYGTGSRPVRLGGVASPLGDVAARLLRDVEPLPPEPPSVPPEGMASLASMVRRLARQAGLQVEVRVEAGLVANAACGERTIFLADRRFGVHEARRLAVHEVLGHLVAAANGRAQPLALLQVGTAGSLADQEGLALTLEEQAGLLDARRLRTLAARVWVADALHGQAAFGDVVQLLVSEHGFSADEAIALAERAYRGGGVARDPIYLYGWLRVRRAVAEDGVTVDELRLGKVGLDAIPALRELVADGALRPPLYAPTLARSLAATDLGTRASTSPPSFAASLMRFDET